MIKTLVKTLQSALRSFLHIKLFTVLRSKIHRKKNSFFFKKANDRWNVLDCLQSWTFLKGSEFRP